MIYLDFFSLQDVFDYLCTQSVMNYWDIYLTFYLLWINVMSTKCEIKIKKCLPSVCIKTHLNLWYMLTLQTILVYHVCHNGHREKCNNLKVSGYFPPLHFCQTAICNKESDLTIWFSEQLFHASNPLKESYVQQWLKSPSLYFAVKQ